MKVVKICIGSACHLKGSYEVIQIFQHLVAEYELEEKMELSAAFCTGHCTEAVAVMRWDEKVLSVSKENALEVFLQEILAVL